METESIDDHRTSNRHHIRLPHCGGVRDMDVEGLMGKPNWYKPYRRRSLYRRWRPWLLGSKSIIPLVVLITVGPFYSEGAVTWPDSLMRKADGYVRSIFQEPPPPEKNTFNPSILHRATQDPR